MGATGIHRIIEHHAAVRGDEPALVGPDETLTYRQLNLRANVVARRLLAGGLRRGAHVIVKMDRSPDLAVILLAVLKAGGAYTWLDRRAPSHGAWPDGVSMVMDNEERRHLTFGVAQLLGGPVKTGPNLPILTRDSDVACILPAPNGAPAVRVPHATITALQSCPVPPVAHWSSEPAAIDLWLPLMAGATVLVSDAAAETAAA